MPINLKFGDCALPSRPASLARSFFLPVEAQTDRLGDAFMRSFDWLGFSSIYSSGTRHSGVLESKVMMLPLHEEDGYPDNCIFEIISLQPVWVSAVCLMQDGTGMDIGFFMKTISKT
jgi:hypothetical protein